MVRTSDGLAVEYRVAISSSSSGWPWLSVYNRKKSVKMDPSITSNSQIGCELTYPSDRPSHSAAEAGSAMASSSDSPSASQSLLQSWYGAENSY